MNQLLMLLVLILFFLIGHALNSIQKIKSSGAASKAILEKTMEEEFNYGQAGYQKNLLAEELLQHLKNAQEMLSHYISELQTETFALLSKNNLL